MTIDNLGKLDSINLREVWANEASDFTPWLAMRENLDYLGETIGIDLELEMQEKNVGPYRADLLCRDTVNDTYVLIENQLEKTNHSHLGQLLTYAAGLQAVTIVWVSSNFTDEHRAALDWLNSITPDEISFFGLEIEAWRIGSSQVAPKFNIVSKPNDWTKGQAGIRTRFSSSEITDIQKNQLEYWAELRNYLESNNSLLNARKPRPQYWYNFAIGRSKFHLSARIKSRDKILECVLIIKDPNAKQHFAKLKEKQSEVERASGMSYTWREMRGDKSSDVTIATDGDPSARDDWPRQLEWFKSTLEKMHEAFSPIIRDLPRYNGEEDEESLLED